MSWFSRLVPTTIRIEGHNRRSIPEGLWEKCSSCQSVLYHIELERHLRVCPSCGHHMRILPRERLASFLDKDDIEEIAPDLVPVDVLKFRDSKRYRDRIAAANKTTGEKEAMIVLQGCLKGMPVVACAFHFGFMGGSMGSVVGEKFARAVRRCLDRNCPLVCFSASGGARMQEGLLSLMQMAKTSMGVADMAEARLPFISVLTDPTTGGVSASFAMLGDINIAEPNALIGFAGPRVIEQTVHQKLPEGFQRSEFLLQHGVIDIIVDRREMRDTVATLLYQLSFSAREFLAAPLSEKEDPAMSLEPGNDENQ